MSEFSDDEPSVNVSPIIAPDQVVMGQHLKMLFGRAHEGKIEITAIHVERGIRTRFFELDDEITDWAEEVNRAPGWNVYVGAALRNPGTFPGSAADDNDFLKTYAVWADADNGDQVASAKKAYRDAGLTPPFVVITGTVPSQRAHLWWPLETPIDDITTLRGVTRGLAVALGTDPKVCTGKQLMRLAGSLAWPKPDKEGRTLERVSIFKPVATQEFALEQITRAFPPIDRADPGVPADIVTAPAGALGLEERVMDGRETYAFRLVRATLREFIGTTGAAPTTDELYGQVAPVYLRRADQVRPGRGPAFLKQKCVEAIRAFDEGQIPGLRSLEEGVMSWAARQRGEPVETDPEEEDEPEQAEPESLPFRASDLTGEAPARQWVVEDWIVQNAVNSLYGDGGVGKTLLAQQLACSVSLGLPWLGLPTIAGSVLAVLCEDDRDELHRRHNAIKTAMGYPLGNPFNDLWLWPRVGEDNELVTWNADNQPTLAKFTLALKTQVEAHRPSLLILDTLTDVYGGDEINRRQVNYFVKTVLGGLIVEAAAAGKPLTVLLLGHPSQAGKSDGRGFSGSTAWNNAVRSRIYLTKPDTGQSDERILTRSKANYAASGDETAIRLFYAEGVLRAQEDAEDSNSLLWSAKKEAVEAVASAWRRGEPYSAQKGHRRHLYALLPAELSRAGFTPQIVRQALRECIEDGKIAVGRSRDKRGYKTAEND